MPPTPIRYTSAEEDSARWLGFPFAHADIVISTRSKCGTTWMQMICALLVFQDPVLPAPLGDLSPWIDWKVEPIERVVGRLQAQRHRRFVKSHTPLDGIPLDPQATYIVVARHPADMAVSLYHQGDNIDRDRLRELTGAPAPTHLPAARPPLREWLLSWIDADADPAEQLDSLPGLLHHVSDAWRRVNGPARPADVVLFHYGDLVADLDGQMRRLARRLGVDVPADRWPALVEAATFSSMRDRAESLAPDQRGVLKDRAAFFRTGRSGAGAALLGAAGSAHLRRRCRSLAADDVVEWLLRSG